MEKRSSLFRNIFVIFFALCFLSAGTLVLTKQTAKEISLAEEITNTNVPDYFLREEYIDDLNDETLDQKQRNSLIDLDTFDYFNQGSAKNYIRLSLAINGEDTNSEFPIYNYVKSTSETSFQFYTFITTVSVSVNGEELDTTGKTFYENTGRSFNNYANASAYTFSMLFTGNTTDLANNEISIMKGGQVHEGIYTVTIQLVLVTCDNYTGDTTEDSSSFNASVVNFSYSFYVLSHNSYFEGNRPNVTNNAFDKVVANSVENRYAYYLYSNYSATSSEIPYLEYDINRFDVIVSKTQTYSPLVEYFTYNANTTTTMIGGDNLLKYRLSGNRMRLYFSDLGEYNVTFNGIKVINENGVNVKYELSGLSTKLQQIQIHMFGYQATYTDLDTPANPTNGSRNRGELKDFDITNGKYLDGADITAKFLASDDKYGQNTATSLIGSETFTPDNIFAFINDTANDGANPITPVKTNQTPVELSANAKLSTSSTSYIFTTVSDLPNYKKATASNPDYVLRYKDANNQDVEEELYSTTFEGRTEGTAGKYIYIIAYTYDNLRDTENGGLAASRIFYQVFYFEINTELPNIKVFTGTETDQTEVTSGMFINQDVTILDTTQTQIYNKKVTVQIYAYNYNPAVKDYYTSWGGRYGVSLTSLSNGASDFKLTMDAKYTIRLYYTSDLVNGICDTHIDHKGSFRQMYFTLDKTKPQNLKIRNVEQNPTTSEYEILSTLNGFATNQSVVLSWDEKDSGVQTFATYRRFPLVRANVFSTDENSNNLSSYIQQMIGGHRTMPINYVLNLDSTKSSWLPYAGNTKESTITSGHVLTEEGLYLIDVYDKAGNHKYEVLMIDKTAPLFTIFMDNKYQLTTSSMYVDKTFNLRWGDFKGIYIANFNATPYTNLDYSPENYTEALDSLLKSDNFYTTKNGTDAREIYTLMYNKLFGKYMKNLQISDINITASDGVSPYVKNYSGLYITIPINDLAYYIDGSHREYTRYEQNNYEMTIDPQKTPEMTIRILIRDESNTKRDRDLTYPLTDVVQYTNYYSARQTIIISFDSSEFKIVYTSDKGEETPVTSNLMDKSTIKLDGEVEPRDVLTTYLSPTKLNKAFSISFIPTIAGENNINIQVESVSAKYYAYVTREEIVNGQKYFYKELSTSAKNIPIYSYVEGNNNPEVVVETPNLDSNNVTMSGKYEITRTYKVDDGFDYNPNDFYSRTFVFYVDRNEVISNPETVGDDNHLESLVGGDIFISMFETGTRANLVVTFPNSDEANSDGRTLYNNYTNDSVVDIPLTTNKLPVKVYVPVYKYTQYVEKILDSNLYIDDELQYEYELDEDGNPEIGADGKPVIKTDEDGKPVPKKDPNGSYHFKVKNNDSNNYHRENLAIQNYVLLAELQRVTRASNGTITSRETIARTSTSPFIIDANGDIRVNPNITDGNGYLNFYRTNGTILNDITQAGIYHLRIIQGRFGTDEESFEQVKTFQFEIRQPRPDFIVRSNSGRLESRVQTSGNIAEIYYTNKSDLTIDWEASTNKYTVDIDIDKTIFRVGNSTYTAKDVWGIEGSETYPTLQDDGRYYATLNLNSPLLNAYHHNTTIDITMQFKNSDMVPAYTAITKRIVVDLSAPSNNVEMLVTNTLSSYLGSFINRTDLRVHRKANYTQLADNLLETSYNISNSSNEYFAYFSYNVDAASYLNTLLASKTQDTTLLGIYARRFTDNTKYNADYSQYQETDPNNFSTSTFTEISTSGFAFEKNAYYEIVEHDLAGNMAIYTIFTIDKTANSNKEEDAIISYSYLDANNEIQKGYYSQEDFQDTSSYGRLKANHNIYSRVGFTLDNINFFGNAWSQITLTTYDARDIASTRYLIMSPWKPGMALSFSMKGMEVIELGKLIDGSFGNDRKNILSIRSSAANSTANEETSFYISVMTLSLSAQLTTKQTSEYIKFKAPADGDINNTLVPTNFLTSLKIVANGTQVLYNSKNRLGFISDWQENANILVYVGEDGLLTFELNPQLGYATNTRIEYTFTDNFKNEYREIHLYRETIIDREISSENDLYSYYDNAGRLYYITQDGFQFTYNSSKYIVKAYNVIDGQKRPDQGGELLRATMSEDRVNGIVTETYRTKDIRGTGEYDGVYSDNFVLEIRDKTASQTVDGEYPWVKDIYFTLHNELPTINEDVGNNQPGQFKIQDANGNNITDHIIYPSSETGYYAEVRILFKDWENPFIPIRYSISTDKITWRTLASGETLRCLSEEMETYYLKIWYDEKWIVNEEGNTLYLFANVPDSQIYTFNLSSLTAAFWIEKTVGNTTEIVKKDNSIFIAPNTAQNPGRQYANHYLVNVSYTDQQANQIIDIKLNQEQFLTKTRIEIFTNPDDVEIRSELWKIYTKDTASNNVPQFETYIVISYVPSKDDIVSEFFTFDMNGTAIELIDQTSHSVVVPENYTTFDRVELQWTKYYGLVQNEINISLVKDGITFNPIVYTRTQNNKQYNYTYLTYSGKYTIMFYDDAGNIQKFNRNSLGQTEMFTFTFLKDVPFTVTYTNPETEKLETTLPIKHAVYNGTVTLNIDTTTRSEFYSPSGVPRISVTRNGEDYTNNFTTTATTFTFTESGYYEVSFSAVSSMASVDEIRKETYQFTILNAKEHRISYVYNRYSNYYVERILKNGQDITERLTNTLDISTLRINGKEYLTQLPISYLDEKTGEGEYLITVNSNNQLLGKSSLATSWTFKVLIKSGTTPIQISLGEGKETTNEISVTFNTQNIYDELGECTFRIVRQIDENSFAILDNKSLTIDADSVGEHTVSIEASLAAGSYFIQFISPSDYLLFSYKVVKRNPMNAASIIAIVISVIVLVVVIILIIKLRKRISVK